MSNKAFTLVEIIVVLVIIGILVAIVLPSVFSNINTGIIQSVQNDLRAVSAGQQKYFEDHSNYCVSTNGCVDFNSINANLGLSLNLTSNNKGFSYSCVTPSGFAAATSYQCLVTIPAQPAALINQVMIDVTGKITCSNAGGSTTCP